MQYKNKTEGTVSGGGTYSEGSRVNISTTAKSGYVFDKWNDGNTQSTRTPNVSKKEDFVAQFKVANSGTTPRVMEMKIVLTASYP